MVLKVVGGKEVVVDRGMRVRSEIRVELRSLEVAIAPELKSVPEGCGEVIEVDVIPESAVVPESDELLSIATV